MDKEKVNSYVSELEIALFPLMNYFLYKIIDVKMISWRFSGKIKI